MLRFPHDFKIRRRLRVEVVISERKIQMPGFDELGDFKSATQRYIYLRGFEEIFDPPIWSTSPGSQALYLAKSGEDPMFLLQFMPPFCRTSRHFHLKTRAETYHLLLGMGILEVDGKSHKLLPGDSFKVEPKQVHQYFSLSSPTLTLLEIAGNPGCLQKQDHFYPS